METYSEKDGKLLQQTEFNRFGIISVIITIVGCLGGVAIGLGAVQNTFTLTLIIVPTMATLSLLLGVAPMKYILISATVSVLIDLILIVYYLLN
ncbi:MAG: hypothetical protein LW688_00140 [Cryomorphaceae bacterium]|nr:hypothetical protein [Cryomorphaceae bacterium]